MFRRIELIEDMSAGKMKHLISARFRVPIEKLDNIGALAQKLGLFDGLLFGLVFGGKVRRRSKAISPACAGLAPPGKKIGKNCRFYFTEKGWEKYGRATVAACQRVGQRYRVICIKEKPVDVFYRDEYQVAVRPRRKRRWPSIDASD